MIMSNFLRNRKSVREFKKKQVDKESLGIIKSNLNSILQENDLKGIKFNLYEDGDLIFENLEGKGGYAGVMIKAPHYIGLEISDYREENLVYGAYFMEKIISDLNNIGLGTCWITITEDLKASELEALGYWSDRLEYMLAFGYEKLRNPFQIEQFSERISVEEIVYDGKIGRPVKIDDLETRGLMDIFYYIRFAPSNKNLQPWRFLLGENKVDLLLTYDKWDDSLLVDTGIIMYYFDNLAKTQGLNNKWVLNNKEEEIDLDGKKYRYIGEFKL